MQKKIKSLFAVFFLTCSPGLCETDDARVQMLQANITKLEQERATKYKELEACAAKTKNYKIAGITTLAVTGVGVYANIQLHKKLASMGMSGASSGGKMPTDPRNTEQKANDECQMFCNDFPNDAAEMGCTC